MSDYPPVDRTPPPPRNANVTGNNSNGNRARRNAVGRSTSQGTVRRPVTRSSTRVGAAIRGPFRFRRDENALIPLIEIHTDSDED